MGFWGGLSALQFHLYLFSNGDLLETFSICPDQGEITNLFFLGPDQHENAGDLFSLIFLC